jgi:Fibronectin type III domain
MADAPDSKQIVAALTDAVKALTTAVQDQKVALIAAIDKLPKTVTPEAPDPIAVNTFNQIVDRMKLKVAPFEPPNKFTATAVSSSQINLSWIEPTKIPDGFKIERRDHSNPFTEIAKVGPNATSFSDSNLSGTTTYYYRARSFNSKGESPYASETSATTK